MNNIRTVIPLKDFKTDMKRWLSHLEKTKEPLLITRHGRGIFVVQDIDNFVGMAELASEGRHQLALNEAFNGSN